MRGGRRGERREMKRGRREPGTKSGSKKCVSENAWNEEKRKNDIFAIPSPSFPSLILYYFPLYYFFYILIFCVFH